KVLALVAVPPDVVTLIGPVVAPAGTVAWITVVDGTVERKSLVQGKRTAVTPGKFVPLMVTFAPTGALVGVKSVIVGPLAETVKVVALVPLKLTAVTPVKFVPLMVTFAPTGALVGVKSVIVGPLAETVKVLALVAVPPDVVTLSGPVVAPAGTVAWITVVDGTVKVVALVPLKLPAVTPA